MEAASNRAWRESQTRQSQYKISTTDTGKTEGKSIQSVDRAISILEALSLRVGLEKPSTILIPCEPSGYQANVGDHDPCLG